MSKAFALLPAIGENRNWVFWGMRRGGTFPIPPMPRIPSLLSFGSWPGTRWPRHFPMCRFGLE